MSVDDEALGGACNVGFTRKLCAMVIRDCVGNCVTRGGGLGIPDPLLSLDFPPDDVRVTERGGGRSPTQTLACAETGAKVGEGPGRPLAVGVAGAVAVCSALVTIVTVIGAEDAVGVEAADIVTGAMGGLDLAAAFCAAI